LRVSPLTVAVFASLALASPGKLPAQRTPERPSPAAQPSPATQPGPEGTPEVTTTKPVEVTQPKPKLDRYKGRVLAFDLAHMIVQSTENEKMVWTFQYSVEMRQRVIELLNSGGYQYGDMVQVFCNPGTTIAVKVKGKPSKAV